MQVTAKLDRAKDLLPRPTAAERSRRRMRKPSGLPVLVVDRPIALSEPQQIDVLLKLYGEVCNSWRALTDVRFKLLGLVPAVSVLILASLLKPDPTVQANVATGLSPAVALLSIVGLLATVGLFTYDRRNSDLHDDLISRARRIESELGIDTGQFRGRLSPSHRFLGHDSATTLVYGASIGGWLVAAVWFITQIRH